MDGLRAHYPDLELFNPGTDFPFPAKKSIDKCRKFFLNMKRPSFVVIDSLILGVIPDLIEEFAAKNPVVAMVHLPLSLNPAFNENQKKHFKESEIRSFKLSEIIIVTSGYTKSEIIKTGIDNAKIHVITPGINTMPEKRNYPVRPRNLLCVSRISSSKGQLTLIKAIERIHQFDWKLTFCGGYDRQDVYYKEIMHRISDSGLENKIVFTGEIPRLEIEEYYRKADLLILTSFFETFSMVLQEAMAFKIPVISTDSGATIQTANPLVAKFYRPENNVELEKHLLSLFTDGNEYKKLADGYSKLDLKFETWSKKTEQFIRILETHDGT